MARADDDVDPLDTDLDADLDQGPASRPDPPPRAPGDPRRRRRRLAAAAAAVVVLVVAGVARQAWVRHEQGPPLDGSASAAELFPVLGDEAAASAAEAVPAPQAAEALGVLPQTARLLAATTDLLFWVAQDGDGDVCLVVRRGEERVRLGGTCAPPAEAAARGVALREGEDGVDVVATLVPEGFDAAPLEQRGDVQLARGLWVGGDTAQQVASDAVDAVSARPVVPTQAQTGDGRLPVFLARGTGTYAVVLACVGQGDGATGGGLAEDRTAGLTVDGRSERVDCSTTPAFSRFAGDGGPVRVDVDVPAGVRWAARVVECEGSLQGPVCDRGRI